MLLVASPCATELALGAVASAFSDAPVTSACCAGRDEGTRHDDKRDANDEHTQPDAQRAACGCCHAFEPPTLMAVASSPLRTVVVSALETVVSAPADDHAEPPFRPPTPA